MKKIDLPLRAGKVTVVIDHEHKQIWKEFDLFPLKTPPQVVPSAVYSFDEEEIKNLFICKVCKQPLEDEEVAWAFWRLQPETCSAKCWLQSTKRR